MSTRLTQHEYETRVSLIEDLLEFHPDLLHRLTSTDQALLAKYYFAGSDISPSSLSKYRSDLLRRTPDIEARSDTAYRRFCSEAGLTNERIVDL
jgi:hypothetical protein